MVESKGENVNGAAARQAGWSAFWPWLSTTLLLLVIAGLLGWQLTQRTPVIMHVTADVPPPDPPAPALVAAAAQLSEVIASREEALKAVLTDLGEPICGPGHEPDGAARTAALNAAGEALIAWQALVGAAAVAPVAGAPAAGVVRRRAAPATEESEPTAEGAEPAPIRRRALPAPTGRVTE